MSSEVLSLVNYYAQIGYYRHMQTVCNEVLKKRGTVVADPVVAFWSSVGLMMEGSVIEAIRELDGMSRRGDLTLPAKVTLLYAHQRCKVVDTEEVARLEMEVRGSEDDTASDRARWHAALVLWHLGELHQSRRQVQALLRLNHQNVQALSLSGLLALADAKAEAEAHGDPSVHFDAAANAFEQAIAASATKKDLEALMGKAQLHRSKEQLKESLDCLNQVLPSSEFSTGLVAISHWANYILGKLYREDCQGQAISKCLFSSHFRLDTVCTLQPPGRVTPFVACPPACATFYQSPLRSIGRFQPTLCDPSARSSPLVAWSLRVCRNPSRPYTGLLPPHLHLTPPRRAHTHWSQIGGGGTPFVRTCLG